MPSRSAQAHVISQKNKSTDRKQTSALQPASPLVSIGQLQRAVDAPGAANPAEILSLQHTYGNQAVQGLLGGAPRPVSLTAEAAGPVVQRALPDAAKYQTMDLADLDLVAVGDAVAAYNAVAGKRTTPLEFQACFNGLQTVDRAIYRWFGKVTASHQRLEGNPHAAEIQALLAEAEREHQDLVDASKDLVDVLPFDTTALDSKDVTALKTLWQEIVHSRGKIKLVGSTAYNRRVASELAKMLSTPTGRGMLKFLNTPKPSEVLGSPESALTNVYIGEKLSNLPQEVRTASPEVEEREHSEAQPLNVSEGDPQRKQEKLTEATESDIGPTNAPDKTQFPEVTDTTMSRVREAIFGGLSGFTVGAKKYEFNTKGTGAFVTSFPGISVLPAKGTGHELMTPGWVTLGHELGHVVNMRAGATTVTKKSHFDDPLVTALAGGKDKAKKWDNAEELLNIENIENALRRESSLAEREGHQPPPWAQQLAVDTRKQLGQSLRDMHQNDRSWSDDPDWAKLERACRVLTVKEVLNPATVQNLRDQVRDFPGQKTAALLPGYLLQISKDKAKADALWAGLADLPSRTEAMLFLHKNVAKFDQIKEKLHFGYWRRRKTTTASRAATRLATLKDLIAGRVTLT